MVILRELKESDAIFMLEWMHDKDIQKAFKKDMLNATIEDVKKFCIESKISGSISEGQSLHFAISEEDGEYLGTVSLKNISLEDKTAEYAITTRKKAQGKGIAYAATGQILKKAFFEYGLHRVYLNVFSDNERAIHMYERCGFKYEGEFREHLFIRGRYVNWKWYGMLKEEYDEKIFNI